MKRNEREASKKRERQKKNAFVVFHAPENVKKENVRTKKCKNRKVRENIFLFFFSQTETNRTSSIATISDIYCIIFLLRAFCEIKKKQNLKFP